MNPFIKPNLILIFRFFYSEILEREMLNLCAKYQQVVEFDLFILQDFTMSLLKEMTSISGGLFFPSSNEETEVVNCCCVRFEGVSSEIVLDTVCGMLLLEFDEEFNTLSSMFVML